MKNYSFWIARLLILALAGMLLFTAVSCKKDKDDPQPANNNPNPNPNPNDTTQTWRTVRISGIRVEAFPANKPSGSNWDSPITGTPEPDIFPTIEIDGRLAYNGESSRYENVKQSDLPKSWTVSGFSPVDLNARIRIVLWDYDSLSSNEEMTSFTFSATNYKPSGSGSTNSYTYNSGGYRIRIDMSFAK